MNSIVATEVVIPEHVADFYASANPGVVKYPDPVLRAVAEPVKRISPDVQDLIRRMITILKRANGLGLAAPQVGVSERVILVAPVGEDIHVLINPEVVSESGAILGQEGCLSLPGLYGDVERAAEAEVRALNRKGKPVHLKLSGMPARIALHEIDHLNGILFTDRAVASSLHWHIPEDDEGEEPEI